MNPNITRKTIGKRTEKNNSTEFLKDSKIYALRKLLNCLLISHHLLEIYHKNKHGDGKPNTREYPQIKGRERVEIIPERNPEIFNQICGWQYSGDYFQELRHIIIQNRKIKATKEHQNLVRYLRNNHRSRNFFAE
jgi:hypothetical protein